MNISVIIPAYNEEKYIRRCIESVKKQKTELIYEIIVVNNNSKDRTKEIAQSFGARVIDEKRKGVGYARRTGTEHANGEIIIHLDADTELYENHLERVWKHFQENPETACLGGQFIFYDANLFKKLFRFFSYRPLLYFSRISSKGKAGAMGNNMAFKKSLYLKTNGFDVKLNHGEDMALCRELSKYGKITVDLSLKVKTSVRRYEKMLSKSFLLYTVNFFFLCIFKKPYKNILERS
jgi:glycosyltransferase involved in cell wall biosynthesis